MSEDRYQQIYEVFLTDVADAEKEAAISWAAQRSISFAERLLAEMDKAISSLSWSPRRGVITPDNDAYDVEVRQFAFGTRGGCYRILYHIQEPPDSDPLVAVLHIRHVAQRLLTDEASDTSAEDA